MDLVWTWNGLGMDLVWTWNGLGLDMIWTWSGLGMDLEWTWSGLGMDLVRTWNGLGMDLVWTWRLISAPGRVYTITSNALCNIKHPCKLEFNLTFETAPHASINLALFQSFAMDQYSTGP
jgi:hypothetical protein